jgi:hypothetical protein
MMGKGKSDDNFIMILRDINSIDSDLRRGVWSLDNPLSGKIKFFSRNSLRNHLSLVNRGIDQGRAFRISIRGM